MWKVFAMILFLLNFYSLASAQNSDDILYLLKADWSSANNIDEATYFMQVVSQNDTTYHCKYYQKFGPMVKQESYLDSNLTVPNGLFLWYNEKGNIDSDGMVRLGKKDGIWHEYDDSAKVTNLTYFDNGKWIKTIDYLTDKVLYPHGRSRNLEEEDEENNVVDLTAQEHLTTHHHSFSAGKSLQDSGQTKHINIQAKYPGGPKGWQGYLQKNLEVPERFKNVVKNIVRTAIGSTFDGQVIVSFVADEEGNVVELMLMKSCEWSADNEALRVIKKAGKWIPATHDGKKVAYRQQQSITFQTTKQ